MTEHTSVERLLQHILALWDRSKNKFVTILVGGCSRTGKSVFVSKAINNFASLGVHTVVMNLDSWLISVDKRKEDSTVLERYEIKSIISSYNKLRQGSPIYPPIYDAVSRKRVAETDVNPIFIKTGILLVEGVIALAIEELLKSASLRIFVDIPDELRKARLIKFYSDVKKLNRKDFESVIGSREKEEVPFIKGTAANADITLIGSENWNFVRTRYPLS